MKKEVVISGRTYILQSEASGYDTGYGVRCFDENGKRGGVQFDVLLNSAMELVSFPYNSHGKLSRSEYEACKQLVAEELKANPNVFHIVMNGRRDLGRLKSGLDEAFILKNAVPGDPEVVAIEKRMDDLTAFIRAAREWSHAPKISFIEFLNEYRSRNTQGIDTADLAEVSRLEPMGPIDLVSYARSIGDTMGKIAVVRTGDMLSRVTNSVTERRDFEWPLPWTFPKEETKWVHLHRRDFGNERSDLAKDVMSRPDTLVLVWTRRTDKAAFERIASVLGSQGDNPHALIGSPEGTFSGRANAIRLAMQQDMSLSPAI